MRFLSTINSAGMSAILMFFILAAFSLISILSIKYYGENLTLKDNVRKSSNTQKELGKRLKKLNQELKQLKEQDQYLINKKLQENIKEIELSYEKSAKIYEALTDMRDQKINTSKLDQSLARSLELLSKQNYASAQATLASLDKEIEQEKQKQQTVILKVAENAPINNSAPGSGYKRQTVQSDVGSFLVDIVAADLNSAKVIVDTASDSDCRDNCPVLPLGDYVSRNSAFAGVNGSYFCPASYPSCAGKTNSFDTLLMNKNKKYFNSDNNVYSTVPVAVFGSGWSRFIGRSLDWGRDTGVDGVIANQPLLLSGGNIAFGGDGDPKKGSKGARSFVAAKDNLVFIGVVHNATVAEMAHVLKTMGIKDALNLDSGGSTALWASGSYRAGPGRNIPNAVLFVRK